MKKKRQSRQSNSAQQHGSKAAKAVVDQISHALATLHRSFFAASIPYQSSMRGRGKLDAATTMKPRRDTQMDERMSQGHTAMKRMTARYTNRTEPPENVVKQRMPVWISVSHGAKVELERLVETWLDEDARTAWHCMIAGGHRANSEEDQR